MCSYMVVAVMVPRFPLLVAALRARRPLDGPVALAAPPGEPPLVGLCTPAAAAQGVEPGLRVGEALARCPALQLVPPDPDAAAEAGERLLGRLEDLGAAVEPGMPGTACFVADGLVRLAGGLHRLLRLARAALPVGAGGSVGAAPGRFCALEAAREAPPAQPLVIRSGDVRNFLAPLPVDRLPLPADAVAALHELGLRSIGQVAALPRAAALERLGFAGLAAWRLARGEDGEPLRSRHPPQLLEAVFRFPEPVGALPALEEAARLALSELAALARARTRAPRALTLRARLEGDGSWSRSFTLREATADPARLAAAALPSLAQITAPVEELRARADVLGPLDGHQLTLVTTGIDERRARAGEEVRQVRSALGPAGVMRAVEIEPWSRRPERRWALVPYDASAHPGS